MLLIHEPTGTFLHWPEEAKDKPRFMLQVVCSAMSTRMS